MEFPAFVTPNPAQVHHGGLAKNAIRGKRAAMIAKLVLRNGQRSNTPQFELCDRRRMVEIGRSKKSYGNFTRITSINNGAGNDVQL